jgi:hypothetical protein
MKAFAVPSVCSAATSVLSLIFYGAFSRFYGDTLLGWVIILTASMSLVQLGLVPQAWLYVVGALDDPNLRTRFSIGVLAEAGGGVLGLCVLAILFSLPIDLLRNHRSEALLVFGGLWIAGSSSLQGLLRARGTWRPYAAWMLVPSVLRVLFIFAFPLATGAGLMPDLANHSVALIAIYFFVPDLIRYLLVNIAFLPKWFVLPSMGNFVEGLRGIWHNWLFDFGSAITESGDKVLVGALVGPYILTAYFFARKIGGAVTLVIEPFYAEHYRRIALSPPERRPRRQVATYLLGLSLGVCISLLGAGTVLAASEIPFFSPYIPEAVRMNILLFSAVLVIDSGISANRWSRYISQSGNRSLVLLIFRVASFLTFGLSLFLLDDLSGGSALALSFALLWLLDIIFLGVMFRSKVPPADARGTIESQRKAGGG